MTRFWRSLRQDRLLLPAGHSWARPPLASIRGALPILFVPAALASWLRYALLFGAVLVRCLSRRRFRPAFWLLAAGGLIADGPSWRHEVPLWRHDPADEMHAWYQGWNTVSPPAPVGHRSLAALRPLPTS